MPKIVKTKVTEYDVTKVFTKQKWCVYDEAWRNIHGSRKNKKSKCFACNKKFEHGEQMTLLYTDRGNKIVCEPCGEKFQAELEQED